jgi:hypothetical protein
MMPTNYLLPATNSQASKEFFLVRVLIKEMSNLEKLDGSRQEVVEIIKNINGIMLFEHINITRINPKCNLMGITSCDFPRVQKPT